MSCVCYIYTEMITETDFKLTEFSVEIPDDLYEEAKRAGLLEPETLQMLIREHLRHMAGKELLKTIEKCHKANAHLPPMTWDEINEAIEEVRREKQGQYGRDSRQSVLSGS